MVEQRFDEVIGMRATTRLITVVCLALGGLIATAALSGCAAYQIGNATLYNPNIRTIYITIVRNDTFRPMVGVQLTEAIQKGGRVAYALQSDR